MSTPVLVACIAAVVLGGALALFLFLHANPRRAK